jgi:putative hemolysin
VTRTSRWLLTLSGCASLYREARARSEATFDDCVLGALNTAAVAHGLDAIPQRGPALVTANHPHGLMDGLALASLVRRTRPDVRLLANRVLSRVPELSDLCFYVDPYETHDAAARSLAGLRAARRWLRDGHVLVVFPSGDVAHRRREDGSYEESSWRDTAARLAAGVGAPIISAHVEGHNSRWFYLAGRVHPLLRTALLGRELVNKRDTTVHVHFAADPIAREVEALPDDACLLSEGSFQVFCATAASIPATLHEIGRLRAETYRAVGEGTGSVVDLDAFDRDYLHVFLWDRAARRVVGAYRLGEVERIVRARGVTGLYTRTLFRYDMGFIRRCGPALELGRSFVRREYQRSYAALLLLWKGIGRFVGRHPHYRVLLGPVSVSARYSERSRQILMASLRRHHLNMQLAPLVEALHPPFEESEGLEPGATMDGVEMPVLLRQYLKLNARLIGFNIDPDFGHALDAFMMVDLTTVDRRLLARYLGEEATTGFLARHSTRTAAA